MRQLSKEKGQEKVVLPPTILFEDPQVLVINKPAGWIVNRADTTTNQPVIENWLAENFKFPIFEKPELRHGVVHRIDKETSGCLIIAKEESAFYELQRQFKERIVHKKYLALTHGELKEKSGEITAPVGRLPWRRDRFGVLPGGRDAFTSYQVVKEYEANNKQYSLVEAFPKTGRTHQIRIHLKYLGNPIVADQFYAGRKTSRHDRKWCPRLFLHSNYIEFMQPQTGKLVKVEAPLPEDLDLALKTLSPLN